MGIERTIKYSWRKGFTGEEIEIAEKRYLFWKILQYFGELKERKIQRLTEFIDKNFEDIRSKTPIEIYIEATFRKKTERKAINDFFEKFRLTEEQKIQLLKTSKSSHDLYKNLIRNESQISLNESKSVKYKKVKN
jgi:hypothetical protein